MLVFVLMFESFDVILGIDCLSKHYARVDCKGKVVQFYRSGKDIIEFQGEKTKGVKRIISGVKAHRLIRQGC